MILNLFRTFLLNVNVFFYSKKSQKHFLYIFKNKLRAKFESNFGAYWILLYWEVYFIKWKVVFLNFPYYPSYTQLILFDSHRIFSGFVKKHFSQILATTEHHQWSLMANVSICDHRDSQLITWHKGAITTSKTPNADKKVNTRASHLRVFDWKWAYRTPIISIS